MTSLAWLIPLALIMGGVGLAAFLWSLESGQYDDWKARPTRRSKTSRRSRASAAERVKAPRMGGALRLPLVICR